MVWVALLLNFSDPLVIQDLLLEQDCLYFYKIKKLEGVGPPAPRLRRPCFVLSNIQRMNWQGRQTLVTTLHSTTSMNRIDSRHLHFILLTFLSQIDRIRQIKHEITLIHCSALHWFESQENLFEVMNKPSFNFQFLTASWALLKILRIAFCCLHTYFDIVLVLVCQFVCKY